MTTRSLIGTLLVLACVSAGPALARGPNGPSGPAAQPQVQQPAVTLSAEESDALLWMREEEKLARDVYLKLYKRWKKPVFQRIAASEQRHFDALGAKIDLYGLTDPALPARGEFTNTELQALYDQLVASGNPSYVAALTVGATIEDMDILDLQQAIEGTDDAALRTTYQNLLEGSKNHLRAFVGQLRSVGADYEPQYIDALLFDAIVGV
jgi:hypothetical protein